MRTWGNLLCVISAILVLLGVSAETTAPYTDTLNIGLMQRQVLLVNGGLAAGLGGLILLGFSAVVEAINPTAARVEPAPPTAEELRRNRIIGGGLAVLLIVFIAYSMWRSQIGDSPMEYNSMDTMGNVEATNTMGTDMIGMDADMNMTDMNTTTDVNTMGGTP